MENVPPTVDTWRAALDERQRKTIAFAEIYVRDFNHGTVGHNDLVLIAKLAELLDVATGAREPPPPTPPSAIRLTFGKHAGKTLGELLVLDWGYLDWLANNARDEGLRSAAATVIHDDEVAAIEARQAGEPPGEAELPF